MKCRGTKILNICTECYPPFVPVKNNKSCEIPCEEGNDEKCLTCDREENIWSSCNIGYKLVNGKCKLNYSFKAEYISGNNENIKFINFNENWQIEEMYIDEKKLDVPCINYTF